MYVYRAKLIRTVDGDTLIADIDVGFNITLREKFRLCEVNTPERGQPEYDVATQLLNHLLVQQTDKDGYFLLNSKGLDKYGRWLADIDGVNIALKERWPYKS